MIVFCHIFRFYTRLISLQLNVSRTLFVFLVQNVGTDNGTDKKAVDKSNGQLVEKKLKTGFYRIAAIAIEKDEKSFRLPVSI